MASVAFCSAKVRWLRALSRKGCELMWLSEALAQDFESNERRASLVHKSRSSALSRSERRQCGTAVPAAI